MEYQSTSTVNSNTTGSAAVYAASGSNNRKPATAQQLIRENVQFLIQQLEQGKSEALTAYLGAMARFHNYSFGNILSIAHFRPNATHVAGIRTWNELGRYVKRGEKGIPILAPMVGIKHQRRDESQSQQDQNEKPTPTLIGFRRVYVWDIAQTEGKELPEPAKVSGEVGDYRNRLLDFVEEQGITLEYSEHIAPAQGVTYADKIVLLPGQSKAEEFATLVHEIGHWMLHRAERRTMTTKTVRETEAEAIAFIVSRAVGLNTNTASADYISLYHGNAELLAESLSVIQQASATILAALFPEEQAEQAEQQEEEQKEPLAQAS
jgi:antirestriction protein ArdC